MSNETTPNREDVLARLELIEDEIDTLIEEVQVLERESIEQDNAIQELEATVMFLEDRVNNLE